MYSGITKIYYRKTAAHVFMKPVQTKGKTQFFPSVSCFSLWFTLLLLGDVSVCSEKTAVRGEVILCWNNT
jgi:hypothetical protein